MEKEITISQISAKFTKDFDSFGKMDPFITFKVGSTIQKTQIAQNAGLQPQWKATIILKATDQSEIEMTAYDQDVTENQYMGTAKFSIKTFKSTGTHKLQVLGSDNKSVGDISFKYQIKQSKKLENTQNNNNNSDVKSSQNIKQTSSNIQTPNTIKITEIAVKFTKNFDTFGKMQPFLTFKLGKSSDSTEIFKDNKQDAHWTKSITLGYNEEKQIQIKAYDQDLAQNQYIGAVTIPLKSLSSSGKHTAQLIGEDKLSIGSLSFKYQKIEKFKPQPSKIQSNQQSIPKIMQQPKPADIPTTKPVEQSKTHQQHLKAESKPLNVDKKQQPKPSEAKITDRVGKKLTQLSDRETEKRQANHENSIYKNESVINKSLNKSRDTLRLPNIGDTSKNFGDKIYDKQSSATLQKSILVYSMPKAPRFYSGPKYCGEPSYYIDSCFKPNSTKGVGFGFGSKRQFPEWMEKNMKENPAPGAYFQPSKLSVIRSRGPTFGISHKFYEKVTIPKQKSPERVTISNQRLKPILRGN